MDRSAAVRQVSLGIVAFVATFLVLLGATQILVPASGIAGSPGPSSNGGFAATPTPAFPAPSPIPTPGPTPNTTGVTSPAPSTEASMPVAPPASAASSTPTVDPVLVGAGDIASCGSKGDEATAALLADIPGQVFTAGDNAYDAGTAAQFRDCYDPTWGRFRDRTWPAAGNHDWGTKDLAGYLGYFGSAATGPGGHSWYAHDLGTWRVIVLDSDCGEVGGCGPDSPQGRWLADELASHPSTCSVAIFHHPRFSSGNVHGDQPAMARLWRPLYAAGVDVVVNGHDHVYERFAPQDPNGRADPARGIREFVVGTGGADLYGFGTPRPNSELRVAIAHGVLALTLHDGSYDWRFHAVAGSDFSDAGTAPCH